MKELALVESFGAVDADNDPLLQTCFEDHEAYLDVLRRNKFLIIGRKGSGKTAIFKTLITKQDPSFFCFGHTFSDYPWHHHDKQARVGIPEADRYTHSWKYLILLSLSKIILNQDQSLPGTDAAYESMLKISNFVVDSYGTKDPDVTQIFSPTKQLAIKANLKVDLKLLTAGIESNSIAMEFLPTIVQEVNQNLIELCMATLNPQHDYLICFDQLDLGFDPSAPEYKSRLIGLLLACRDLNIAARGAGQQFFVAVFLRQDIYDFINFEDKNKLTENFLSLIEWDTRSSRKTLKDLMSKRFDMLLKVQDEPSITWEGVFDESMEMAGRQSKYDHIIDRTFLRPRDIIRLCNTILEQYKDRLRSSTATSADGVDRARFLNEDIIKARPEYSDYLLRELEDELHKHLPDYQEFLRILQRVGKWQFTMEQFKEAYAFVKSTQELTSTPTPEQILESLFSFSIIGCYRPGGRGYGGSEYVFRYKEPQLHFEVDAIRFRVHLGLVETLGLKRSSSSSDKRSPDDSEALEDADSSEVADNHQ